MSTTQWWWVRHAPVPDGGRIYGQRDLDCDCSDGGIFTALARELPREAVWVTSNLKRATQTAAAIHAAMGQPHRRWISIPERRQKPGFAKPTAAGNRTRQKYVVICTGAGRRSIEPMVTDSRGTRKEVGPSILRYMVEADSL